MLRNETMRLDGDSIWGRITLLLSSLLHRPCTGKERAQFYEDILIKSLKKEREKEPPVQYLVDEAVMLLNKEGDRQRAKYFLTVIRKLRNATDASDEIIRFLILISRIGPDYATKDAENMPPFLRKSRVFWKGTENVPRSRSILKQPFIDHTNLPCIAQQSLRNFASDTVLPYSNKISSDVKPSEFNDEDILHMVIDGRGRIYAPACNPELRSIWRLQVGEMFYMMTWYEYFKCLVHMIVGEETTLFRRKADGCFTINKEQPIFLKLEDLNLLPRLALPFLTFANRLWLMEKFLTFPNSVNIISTYLQTREITNTKALLILKHSASEQLWKFRDGMRHLVQLKKGNADESIREFLPELLDMCNIFDHFVDLVLHLKTIGTQDINSILDVFYIADITKGRIMPAFSKLCDYIIEKLIRHYADSLLLWFVKGIADPCDGVFSPSNSSGFQWAVIQKGEAVNLEPSLLIGEDFCRKWMCEGKFRSLILDWLRSDEVESEEYNYAAIENVIKELSENYFQKTLRSKISYVLGPTLDRCFQKIYRSQRTEWTRDFLSEIVKQTVKLLRDVYLCEDEFISELFVSALLNENYATTLNKNAGGNRSFQLDKLLNYLLGRNYCSNIVLGFFHLTGFNDENDLKIRYKPSFPLHIIFTPSVLLSYESIWKWLLRLAVECTALENMLVGKVLSYDIAMMQMRMWNFVRALRYFFHDQIANIYANEFQGSFNEVETIEEISQLHRKYVEKILRHCLLGSKRARLWHVLNECLLLVTEYRLNSAESCSALTLSKIFNEFHDNAKLFCSAVRRTSVGADFWLSDLLLLADFSTIYMDLNDKKIDC